MNEEYVGKLTCERHGPVPNFQPVLNVSSLLDGARLRLLLFFEPKKERGQKQSMCFGSTHSIIVHMTGNAFDRLREIVSHFHEKDAAKPSNLPTDQPKHGTSSTTGPGISPDTADTM